MTQDEFEQEMKDTQDAHEYKAGGLVRAAAEVSDEFLSAIRHFPPMVSPHEGLAIIQEELFELQLEVYKQHDVRDKWTMRKEAKQVAAMALRFMVDLT